MNKMCASGMKSIMTAAQNIAMGHTVRAPYCNATALGGRPSRSRRAGRDGGGRL